MKLKHIYSCCKYADSNANIFLRNKFITDEELDIWVIASDVVVVPYKEIWSSGVLA